MKICIVSLNIVPYYHATGKQYGGAEVQSAVMADAFRDAGAEVVLVVADQEPEMKLPHASENAYRTVAGIRGTRFFHPRLTGILAALRRSDADVYFQHCAGMITGLVAWHARRSDRRFVYYAGSDTDFSPDRVRIDNVRDRRLFYYGLKNAHGIVVQNESQAQDCRELLGRDPLIIPTAVVPRTEVSQPHDGSVVWVGALRAVKDPERFMALARALPNERFVMIGGGMAKEPEYAQKIMAEAQTIPNLIATGRIPHDEVAEYLSRAAVLVNTSKVEGFPNAYLEAWKSGVPVMSLNDVDGLIEGQRVGRVCRELSDLTVAVAALLSNPAEREAMSTRALALIDERYSATTLAQKYMDYFASLSAQPVGEAS